MTALTHDHLQIGASACPAPLQHVSMLLEGRFGGSLVESHWQVLYGSTQFRWGREPVHIESHILIVDDDLQIRKLLGRYLAEQGFRVTLASDKRSLEAALESNDIKLIVLDVMLPDGSGLDICRDMRAADSQVR